MVLPQRRKERKGYFPPVRSIVAKIKDFGKNIGSLIFRRTSSMTPTQSPLSFRVWCSACYGVEIWRLERIVHVLNVAGKLSSPNESDIELVAEQFIAYSKHILCPGCGKTGTVTVNRVVPET
jgi:hypothetical protein